MAANTDGLIVKRRAKDTLTAVELNKGQTLEFMLADGSIRHIALKETFAEVTETTLKELLVEENAAVTNYRFTCTLEIEGEEHQLERTNSSQASFYEPWEIDGMRIWFDAVDDIFAFLADTHGGCRPGKDARFGIQDASMDICPEKLNLWCPLPEGGLTIDQCYRGEDVWMGAYNGASAHGGLDINHPPGTPLWAPFDLDEQFFFNTVEMGYNNNRWRGLRRWENGAEWIIQAHHMTGLTVPEHTPVKKGEQFANGAGVLSGAVDHSHFVFKIYDAGEIVMLDPWILFQKMYKDQE